MNSNTSNSTCDTYQQSKAYVELIVAELQKIAPGRFSSALVNQIAYFPYNGMNSPYEFILPEILHLEEKSNPSQTKAAEKFSRNPLMAGLWKKHFFLPHYIAMNYSNYWKVNSQRSQKFEQHFNKIYGSYVKSPTLEKAREVSAKIADDFINIPQSDFDSGKRKKTGEYIIFKKHEGLNYYLCLGFHRSDDKIIQWVNEAYKDFPFLNPTSPTLENL